MVSEFLAFLLGKGWVWDRCGVCNCLFWIGSKKRSHRIKFRSADNEYAWVTLPICLDCSIDFSKMEKDAEYVRRTKRPN
jgi:hypothetical protein